MTIRYAPLSITDTTNAQGVKTVSIIIPGTFGRVIANQQVDTSKVFGGANRGKTEGRWLKKIEIWADSVVAGDKISQIRVVDSKPVLPANLIAKFVNYPIIFDLLERKGQETATVLHSLFLPPSGPLLFQPANDPIFLPADLRLEIRFEAGAVLLGRRFRANITWGHQGID